MVNPMGKKQTPKPDDAKQSQRFVETARKLGSDESGKAFDLVIGVIAPAKNAYRRKAKAPNTGRKTAK
jgi:hypothetical protein